MSFGVLTVVLVKILVSLDAIPGTLIVLIVVLS